MGTNRFRCNPGFRALHKIVRFERLKKKFSSDPEAPQVGIVHIAEIFINAFHLETFLKLVFAPAIAGLSQRYVTFSSFRHSGHFMKCQQLASINSTFLSIIES